MVNKKETLSRRSAVKGIGAFLTGLAFVSKDGTSLVQAAEMLSPLAAFRSPDAIYSAPLLLPGFEEAGQDFSWGPMDFTSRVVHSEPITVEGDLAFKPLIRKDMVLEAPLTLVITKLRLHRGGVGITHLLPDSDKDQPSIELRPDGDMRAMVRTGINGEKLDQTQSIGKLTPGENEFYLAMMLSNSGSTFGAFSPDGVLRNETDLTTPPVEVGQPSTLVAYTFGSDARAEILSTVIATQRGK